MKYKNKYKAEKIEKIEDLKTWREARKLAQIIYRLTRKLPEHEKYNLKKHMHESVRNIPGNIAEGFGRRYFKESTQFYSVALGSLDELKSDCYLCFDNHYITEAELKEATSQNELVNRLINGLMSSAIKVKPLSSRKQAQAK